MSHDYQPHHRGKCKYLTYSEESLRLCMEAVTSGALSINKTSTVWNTTKSNSKQTQQHSYKICWATNFIKTGRTSSPDCVYFPSYLVKYVLCFTLRHLMMSWHLNIWEVKIWLSQERKELSMWNEKHFLLFQNCSLLDIASKNVANRIFKEYPSFKCSACTNNIITVSQRDPEVISRNDKFEVVDSFHYLGDSISQSGSYSEAKANSVTAWQCNRKLDLLC